MLNGRRGIVNDDLSTTTTPEEPEHSGCIHGNEESQSPTTLFCGSAQVLVLPDTSIKPVPPKTAGRTDSQQGIGAMQRCVDLD